MIDIYAKRPSKFVYKIVFRERVIYNWRNNLLLIHKDMAPSIEKIIANLKVEESKAIENAILISEICALRKFQSKFTRKMEGQFVDKAGELNGRSEFQRDIQALGTILTLGVEELNFAYLKCIKHEKERRLFKRTEQGDFFLGIAVNYDLFKERYPNLCNEYSGIECMEIRDNCWDCLNTAEDWSPKNGEVQILQEENKEDEVIISAKVGKESPLYSGLKRINERTSMFN